MASAHRLALLLVAAVACGDDGSASVSDSQSGTGDTGTSTDTTGTNTSSPNVPTTGETGDAGSDSASASEASEASATDTTAATEASATEASASEASASEASASEASASEASASDSATDTTDTTDTTACVDVCADGDIECVGDEAVHACEIGDGGCLQWAEPDPCPGGHICEAGACVPGCSDACDLGAKQCAGNGVATCVDDPQSSCTVWSAPAACPAGDVCQQGACVTPMPTCLDDCVFTEQSVPSGVDFYSVWGSDAKAVWVVGASGTALYYNGVNWKAVDSGVGKRLDCVHGSAADDVYAISLDGVIIRWDGVEWLPHADLNPTWDKTACLSVLGPKDLLALVYDENGEKQVLWRVTDGVKTQLDVYSPQAIFTPSGTKSPTVSIRAFGPDSALMTASRALSWDGVDITNMNAPNPSFGLWALAPDLAYAVASHSGIGHRWNGQEWKIVNPGLSGYLHMFAGTAANRIFGVGETVPGAAAIVAFDGIGWVPLPTPATAKSLFAAWAAPTGELFAVGRAGTVLKGE